MEFHADTTQLVQMLKKGHYNVKLDAEAWDRLVTWIDLNCPFHGTWGEEIDHPGTQRQRRRDLLKLYANVDDDPEAAAKPAPPVRPLMPEPAPPAGPKSLACPGWPFDAAEARRRQAAWARRLTTGIRVSERRDHGTGKKIDLGKGVFLEMVLIPPGDFVMGSTTGAVDEQPLQRLRIEKPFWMATKEVTNQMYSLFDPSHNSGIEDRNGYQFGLRGFPMNGPEQPVVRVSWNEAVAFCRWLSKKTGRRFRLPTEAEWEYACRAGTLGSFSADVLSRSPSMNVGGEFDHATQTTRACDPFLDTSPVGNFAPNRLGLYDMHGNAWEWCSDCYAVYPEGTVDNPHVSTGPNRILRGDRWSVSLQTLPVMAAESFLFALPIFGIGYLCRQTLPMTTGMSSHSLLAGWCLSLGAGVYEELLFRLYICGAAYIVCAYVFKAKPQTATVVAVILSSVLFSLYHYLGPEKPHLFTFVFRTLAGVYFAILFSLRGYGITAGAHAFYDVIVVSLAPI